MINPIDKQQRERLMGAKRRLTDLVNLLTRCKNCGIDVAEREEIAMFLMQRLEAVETNFIGAGPMSQSPQQEAFEAAQAAANLPDMAPTTPAQVKGRKR